MSKEIYISSTPHETRLAIVENDELTEIYYERENEYTLAGSIYNGRVTRVLPGMQSSFVDIGLERDAFLYITDFMEEAADTADFDHGEKPQHAQRLEAPQNARVERNDPERNGGYVSERNQEQARSTPQTDAAQASEGRNEEFDGRGERNERGGRGRGRNRRDRGGNQSDRPGQDRPALAATPLEEDAGPRVAQELVTQEESFEVSPYVGSEPQTNAGTGQEIGEGAPGADGSRRWRGRRGRRRGRATGAREGTAPSGSEPTVSLDAPVTTAFAGAEQDEFDEEPVFEIDGSAEIALEVEVAPAPPILPSTPPQRTEASGRREQPGRDGRDNRVGRGDRSQRNERPGGGERNAPRAPRGFAPTRALYGVDAEPEAVETSEAAPSIEPLILPGESLGKYRKGSDEAVGTTQPRAVAPQSDFVVDPSWDGGAMLPGETLSRYRGGVSGATQARGPERADPRRSEGRDQGRNDGRNDGRRNEGRRDSRSERAEGGSTDRGSRRDAEFGPRREFVRSEASTLAPAAMMVPSTVPPVDPQSAGPVSGYAHADASMEEIQAYRPDFTHAPLPEATAEAPAPPETAHTAIAQVDAAQVAEEPIEEEAKQQTAVSEEYEPEEASASYRIDPTPPSEYRQSAPTDLEAERQPVGVDTSGQTPLANHEQAENTVILDSLYGGSAAVDESSVGSHRDSAFLSPGLEANPRVSHEVTTLNEMGTMASEPEVTAAAVSIEASPNAIEVEADDLTDTFDEQVEAGAAPHQDFAPGMGDLEEDFIDEEEFENPTLHAQGAEDFDEMEEEPLEGAADLGTMIRDMSLDQMTSGANGVEEEDDDFEEDTLEEDIEYRKSEPSDDESMQDEEGPDTHSFTSADDLEDSGRTTGLNVTPESAGFAGDVGHERPAASGDADRRGRRSDGRRGGRDRERGRGGERSDRSGSSGASASGESSDRGYDRGGLGERARNTGGGGDRDRGRSGGRGRQSMQMTNLPAISELLKPGQEILCQIAKEPIAKKGARITSHIALPGRFLVFMPTVSHTGVSRKIESDAERRRLKEILLSEKGDAAGGFIVRTAAGGASEDELRSDLRFLLNLWADIKARSESSKSPALIYHDLNLVERILRDQVTDNFSAIWVDTETEYERVLRFLQRFQPALIRRVKLYTKETPLFEQFGITEEINKALRSKVWLKSGGSIVINQTEALVAIDINTGKYVGKTARLEDTIVKTNLDAIPEIVRQIRLRDLGGIIIIDFIDMDERKNRNRVMAALEDELKNDRAPSKVLPFNDFGLVAITRKRVKQSLERTLSTPCTVCVGTGMVKSPVTVCNDIYVEMRKMHKHLDRGDVMLRVHPEVVKQLKLTGSKWLQEMEEMCGKTILIKSDPALHPEQFDIH